MSNRTRGGANIDHLNHFTRALFLTTRFKTTTGCSFSLTTGFKCSLGRVQKWTPPLPTAAHFQTDSKSKQGIPTAPNVPESLAFSGFPNILFIPFVSNKRFTFLCKRSYWYNLILPLYFLILPYTFWFCPILFDFAPMQNQIVEKCCWNKAERKPAASHGRRLLYTFISIPFLKVKRISSLLYTVA